MAIPTVNMAATGRNINMLRMRAGMTVHDVQSIMGFNTPQAIYKWLRGESLPTIDNMVILAAIFHVALDEIIVVDTNIVATA